MKNPYLPKIAILKKIQPQIPEVKLFTLTFKNKKDQLNFVPGQFVEIGLPGFGEAPFALCSKYSKQILRGSDFQVCIRKAGELTEKLHNLKPNDFVTVRGPYGNGWPIRYQISDVRCQNLLLIAGGIGLVPFRSLIYEIRDFYEDAKNAKANPKITLFYGAKRYHDLLFKNEYKTWQKYIDLHLIIDKPDKRWKGNVGLITDLIEKQSPVISHQSIVFLCGPPIMYKFVLQKLKSLKIPDENIYLSLERRMHCGIGVCQHCAIGSKYVCKNGPIFNWAEIRDIPEVI